MDQQLFEQLLRRGESETLDFKREQYPFRLAVEDKKGELVKDIVAMANSWRDKDAYILIGVDENAAGDQRVCGVTEHLSDSDVQQLVNSKIAPQRLVFSYTPFEYGGRSVGVIHIPPQAQRPFWLKKPFGRLQKNVVYVRRGSSTLEADPDEIAELGQARQAQTKPTISVEFGDPDSREMLGPKLSVSATVWKLLSSQELPVNDWRDEGTSLYASFLPGHKRRNDDYYEELQQYIATLSGAAQLGFVIRNESSSLATSVRVVFQIAARDGLVVVPPERRPEMPQPAYETGTFPRDILAADYDIEARLYGAVWHISIDVGKVKPKDTVWVEERLLLGNDVAGDLVLEGQITGDNFEPQPAVLTIAFSPSFREITPDILHETSDLFASQPTDGGGDSD